MSCYVCGKSTSGKRRGIPLCGTCHYDFDRQAERERPKRDPDPTPPSPRITAPMPFTFMHCTRRGGFMTCDPACQLHGCDDETCRCQ